MRQVQRTNYGTVPFTRYDERPGHPMRGHRFDDAMYAKIVDSMVIDCVDAIVTCLDDPGKVWLAERATKPMQGLWIIGGRRRPPMAVHEAMVANFKRETSLELPPERFRILRINEYTWADREQEPQDGGSHNSCATFVVELSSAELEVANANLERNEYRKGKGLEPFDRAGLAMLFEHDRLHPMILDLYDQIFAA